MKTGHWARAAIVITAAWLALASTPDARAAGNFVPSFIRGDANADDRIDIADAVTMLKYLFLGTPDPGCLDALDANDDGAVDISDALTVLFYLFVDFDTLRPGECIASTTEDSLSCLDFSPCGTPPLKTNSIGMEMIFIPSGTFVMGSPPDEPGREQGDFLHIGERAHQVSLSHGFYMSKTEVTQAQYLAIRGQLPVVDPHVGSYPIGSDLPVLWVTWFDANRFCTDLSKNEGVQYRYRLPTEAEWEYACRAGTTTRFSFGDALSCPDDLCCPCPPGGGACCPRGCDVNDFMWWCKGQIGAVGQKRANVWGLQDMHGNAFEWCMDWAAPYPAGPVTDPIGPSTGIYRIIRSSGQVFNSELPLAHARSAARYAYEPEDASADLGFRIVQAGPLFWD